MTQRDHNGNSIEYGPTMDSRSIFDLREASRCCNALRASVFEVLFSPADRFFGAIYLLPGNSSRSSSRLPGVLNRHITWFPV